MQRSLAAILFVILVPQAHAVRPFVIYGGDDRVDYYQLNEPEHKRLADATVALIRASNIVQQGPVANIRTVSFGQSLGLCPSEPFYEQETAAFCSGSLVAPDVVITAGHCLRTQSSCDAARFVFGFRVEAPGHTPRSVPADNVFSCKQLIHSVANPGGEDFAVVRLDRPVGFVQPLLVRATGRAGIGDSLRVMGHPSGLPLKIAGGATVRALQPEYLVANLDTYGGNSGSAVFNAVTGEVEGILVRGEMDFVYQNGCRASNRCKADECRGEDVTLIERVRPYLPVNLIKGN